MPRDQFSDLRRAYSEALGVTVRTAQRHQKAGHPDWLKFIGATAAEGVKRKSQDGKMERAEASALAAVSPMKPAEVPGFYDVPDEDLHPVQLAEKRAWELLDQTFRTWEGMLSDVRRADMAIVYARELPKLRADFEEARKRRTAWEMEERRIFDLSEFEAFQSKFLVPLAEMLGNLPTELPPVVNPQDPVLARGALERWVREKVQPRLADLLREAEGFRPAA